MSSPGKSAVHFLRYLWGWDEPETQTTALEQQALARHGAGKRRLAEIGVFEGFTTRRLAEAMAGDGELFAIDPFTPGRFGGCWGRLIARKEVAKVKTVRRVRFIPKFSHEAAAMIKGDFDFVFLDGDHSLEGIRRDWVDWAGRLGPGGIMALHDTRVPAHNPAVATLGSHIFFESDIRRDSRFELVEQVDSLSVLRRRS